MIQKEDNDIEKENNTPQIKEIKINDNIENQCIEELWLGSLPVEFSLSNSDLSSCQAPECVYMLCPRIGYLPVASIDVVNYFIDFAIEFSKDVWFSYNDIPLKCNLPIGVLYDMQKTTSSMYMIPWKISVHFSSFPNDKLLRCTTIETSERYFDHSLKQALYLLHGTSSSFYNMSVENKQQIWESITRSKYDLFKTIAITLKPKLIDVRLVPIRIIRHNKPTIQKPIQTINSNDTDMLLSDVLDICLPSFNFDLYSVLIQGVEIPLSAPVFSVWSIFSHADFFLYICLISHTE